jgi:uncharacterized protein (TIGR01777 family)
MGETFVRLARIEATAKDVYVWHQRPGAVQRLTPPWVRVDVLTAPVGLQDGAKAVLRVHMAPWRFQWELEHMDCVPDHEFTDVQIRGPFRVWRHRHVFEDDGTAVFVEDRVEYEAPFGRIGHALAGTWIRAQLERLFLYRHRVLARDLAVHRSYHQNRRLKILLTGASGFIGSTLRHFLTTGGHEVLCVTRNRKAPEGWLTWDPQARRLDVSKLNGLDAVIHLAGHPILPGRWTSRRLQAITESRVETTRWLANLMAAMPSPPSVFITASAIGCYGDRGADYLDEESPFGQGFLPRVCFAWEDAAQPAAAAGIRTVHLRFGIVLSPSGGLLAMVLPLVRLGLAGPLGSGQQFVSWIAMDDAVEAIYHALWTTSLRGPVNVVSPTPTTQHELFRTLAYILRRPYGLPTPAVLLRAAFGQAADEAILASARVQPVKLQDSGFLFHFSEIEAALRHVLGYG